MLTAQTLHPSELEASDIAAWRGFCVAGGPFDNPLLWPDFALAVGDVREDARVAVWRRDGVPVGFLAYHLRPGAFGRPIGAPFSDYHALVGELDLNVGEALALVGLSAYRFTGLIDPAGAFQSAAGGGQEGFLIKLESGAEDYLETLRAASPKRFKNYRRLDSKLGREVGDLKIVAPDHSQAAFDAMIEWKRDQLRRTGMHDFLRPDWSLSLLQSLFERREGEFQGLMIGLYAGDELVAVHFGVRGGGVYHPWLASTSPEHATWSPGQVYLLRAIAAMPGLGLTTYDLGLGHDHYKKPYALSMRPVTSGLATAAGSVGQAAKVSERAWQMAGAEGKGLVGRLRRRMDLIATVELSLAGRARGFAEAISTGGRKASAAADIA